MRVLPYSEPWRRRIAYRGAWSQPHLTVGRIPCLPLTQRTPLRPIRFAPIQKKYSIRLISLYGAEPRGLRALEPPEARGTGSSRDHGSSVKGRDQVCLRRLSPLPRPRSRHRAKRGPGVWGRNPQKTYSKRLGEQRPGRTALTWQLVQTLGRQGPGALLHAHHGALYGLLCRRWRP